jgi:phage baseplate assembly protein V
MIDRSTIEQLRHMLRPLATRIANTVARGVVQLVRDAGRLQAIQVGVMSTETVEDAEHHQPYGFTSVPLTGAEAVVLFPDGDRTHPLVVAVSDRRYRPTGGDEGDVTIYHHEGARVLLLAGGNIEVRPGPGGTVYVRDEDGTADALVKRAEYNGHTHAAGTLAAPNGAVSGITAGAAAVAGTQRLKAQ